MSIGSIGCKPFTFEMRLKNSFWALLGRHQTTTPDVVLEQIRTAMLDALDRESLRAHVALDAKISSAVNVQELWYLRPELLNAISSCRGESVARQALEEITRHFVGHHPGAITVRRRM